MSGEPARPASIECLGAPDEQASNILRVQIYPGPLARRRAMLMSLVYCVPYSLFQLRRGDLRDVGLMFAVLAPISFLCNLLIARQIRAEVRVSGAEFVIKSVHYRLRDGWSFRVEPERFSPGRWRLAAARPSMEAAVVVVSELLKEQAEYLAGVLTASVERARGAA